MLGEKLKKLRGNRTQDDIAQSIGISRSRYSHYENNIREPDLETLEQIANFHNVTVDYLLGRSEKREDKKKLEKKLDLTELLAELHNLLDSRNEVNFNGAPLSVEDKEELMQAIESFLQTHSDVTDKKEDNN